MLNGCYVLNHFMKTFLQELNRLRRAALSFGFHDLLDAMATMLEVLVVIGTDCIGSYKTLNP
jgi:hypothetical protein